MPLLRTGALQREVLLKKKNKKALAAVKAKENPKTLQKQVDKEKTQAKLMELAAWNRRHVQRSRCTTSRFEKPSDCKARKEAVLVKLLEMESGPFAPPQQEHLNERQH